MFYYKTIKPTCNVYIIIIIIGGYSGCSLNTQAIVCSLTAEGLVLTQNLYCGNGSDGEDCRTNYQAIKDFGKSTCGLVLGRICSAENCPENVHKGECKVFKAAK